MKGLDTNVLVRYFIQDDPTQSVAAECCIQTACTADQPCLIHAVVLCELVWVLETAYGYSRDQIINVLDLVLRTRQFQVQEREILCTALNSYHSGTADFADAVIGHGNRAAGCETTYTFDRKAARLPEFTAL
jgi:predicted nucleic-acid-binding protein